MRAITSLCAALCVGLPAYASEWQSNKPYTEEAYVLYCHSDRQVLDFLEFVDAGLSEDQAAEEVNKFYGSGSCEEDLILFVPLEIVDEFYLDLEQVVIEVWRIDVVGFVAYDHGRRHVKKLERKDQFIANYSDAVPPPEELYDPLEPLPDEEEA